MDFATSTHATKWIISSEEVEARCTAANQAGTEHVMKLLQQHDQPTLDLQPLTAAEEAKLVLHYTHMLASQSIKKLCPKKVVATAITFVKRFYLDHSNMEHDALRVSLTCLYIAGKACEHYMDAETMQEAAKGMVKSKEILELETAVLQCLQFDLVVYEPFALVDAVVEELRVALKGGEQRLTELADAKPDALQLTHKLAYSFLDSMLQSSAPLTMRPQQQALCAVCHALVKYGMTRQAVLERYAAKATGGALNGNSADVVQALDATLREGDRLAQQGHATVSKDEVRELDRKVRTFNPLMDKSSELYKQLKGGKRKRKRREGT